MTCLRLANRGLFVALLPYLALASVGPGVHYYPSSPDASTTTAGGRIIRSGLLEGLAGLSAADPDSDCVVCQWELASDACSAGADRTEALTPAAVITPGSLSPCPEPDPNAARAGGLALAAVILYWTISEGSRVCPARNLIPVP
jgi:hypothetical protein